MCAEKVCTLVCGAKEDDDDICNARIEVG